MEAKRKRALIAARPPGCRVLRQMLEDTLDILPAYTMDNALELLSREPLEVDLILATFTFDESQMIEFLQTVKRDPHLRGIPFYCARVRRGVLPDNAVDGVGTACKECGAADFVDAARLPGEAARRAIKAMLGI